MLHLTTYKEKMMDMMMKEGKVMVMLKVMVDGDVEGGGDDG